jgi:cell division protein FtsB
MKKHGKYIVLAVLILSVIFLITRKDLRVLILNKMEVNKLHQENIRLDKEYEDLTKEHKKIQESDEYLEEVARTELNMTKPGELEYRFESKDEDEKDKK